MMDSHLSVLIVRSRGTVVTALPLRCSMAKAVEFAREILPPKDHEIEVVGRGNLARWNPREGYTSGNPI